MRPTALVFILVLLPDSVFGQSSDEKETVEEGKRLYKSEMASWYGTDAFLEKVPQKKAKSGGYFSYDNGDFTNCVFFSREEIPRSIFRVSFDSTFNPQKAPVDTATTQLTELEASLFKIRSTALKEVNTDTLFKTFRNSSLNFIPLIDKRGKRVYIITGPQNSGVVLFGNDYLLKFNESGEVKSKSKLHKGLIPIEYGKDDKVALASMHTHLPKYSEIITPTDVCTLMLYAKYAKWNQHIVMSEKSVSTWDCNLNKLVVMTKKAWEKIYDPKSNLNKN